MARPRAQKLTVYTKYNFHKLKDGTTSVYRVEYQYDYDLKNYRGLSSKKIGYLPEGCTDIKDMIPVENSKPGPKPGTQRKNKTIAKISAQTPLCEIQDTRQQDKITYPSYLAFFVLMMCAGAGMSTTPQVAEFWRAHHDELCRLFADCPDREISHDTVRDFYILLGKTNTDMLLKSFNAMLLLEEGILHELEQMNSPEAMEAFYKAIYALDGQAVRATKIHPGSKNARFIMSFYNCVSKLAVAQELVDEKTNEITYGPKLVNRVDVRGGIVTADAMHAQKGFAQAVLDAGADYCLGLKSNQKTTEESIRKLFTADKNRDLMCCKVEDDKGHDPLERRDIRVLPGSLLSPEILEKWPGLSDGCIAELCSTKVMECSEEKAKPEYRYYFSSLYFNKEYIAALLLHVIRSHLSIENKLYWVLDVTFDQDITQCNNSDCLKGKTILNNIMYNFMSVAKRILEKERNKRISMQSMKPILTHVKEFLSLISKFCILSTTNDQ